MDSGRILTSLGTESIGTLLRQYAVPAIIAMTASSLYNMVDSVFIGNGVGPYAISGLGVCFPLVNLSTAFGTLVGVGASTMISVLLGQKNYDGANKVLTNLASMNIIIGGLFTIVCLCRLEPILRFFGATDYTLPYASEYVRIILYGNIVTHLYFGLNGAMRSCGKPRFAMGLTLFTVIFNTVLDPLFIFTFNMGVKGAAIATVIAQLCALIVILREFSRKDEPVHLGKGILKIDWNIAKNSLQVGMGPFLMNSAACIVNLFVNQQLLKYSGDLGIGAYSIAHRISFIFIMIIMGLNQGMQPIAGYNYGARKYTRVRKVFSLTVIYAVIVTSIGFAASMLFPELMCRAFTSDAELLDISAAGLRMMNSAFPIIGFQIVSTNLFQSIGMVNKSIFLSMSRQLLYLVPCLYLLPLVWGADGIWYSFPISDSIAFAVTVFMIWKLLKLFKQLNDGDDPSILGSKL